MFVSCLKCVDTYKDHLLPKARVVGKLKTKQNFRELEKKNHGIWEKIKRISWGPAWPPLAIHHRGSTGSVINQGNKTHTSVQAPSQPQCPSDIMCRISSPIMPLSLSVRALGRHRCCRRCHVPGRWRGFQGQGDSVEETGPSHVRAPTRAGQGDTALAEVERTAGLSPRLMIHPRSNPLCRSLGFVRWERLGQWRDMQARLDSVGVFFFLLFL